MKFELDTKTVNVGATVTLVQVESKKKGWNITIVGSAEKLNPLEGKISNESPIGKAILGKKKGNKVQVQLPNGNVVEYKIQNIKIN